MEITSVKVKLIDNGKPRMKGIANVRIDNCFSINGIRIIENNDCLFAAMPSRKGANGEFYDICHPIDEKTREMFNNAVIEEYNKMLNSKQ